MKRVFKVVADVIFVFVIIVLVGYFLLRDRGILEIYKVETGSMEQGIHAGDYVLICEKDKYVVGDIVTYRKDDYFITHRIVKKVIGDKVVTKGDANNTEDEEIAISSIEGKVIYHGIFLNVIIDYKFAIISLFLGLYLLSCYFAKDNEKSLKNSDDEVVIDSDDNKDVVVLTKRRYRKKIRPQYRNKI